MLVVADEFALGVCRKSSLTCAGETEEDSGRSLLHVGVGRAVHRSDATERIEVVHHREHTLLHFAAIPSVDDHLLTLLDVESNYSLRVETEFLVVFAFSLRSVEYHEVGLELLEFFFCGADEHVGNEVSLPSHLHDEAHAHASALVGAAEDVDYIESLVFELLDSLLAELVPHLSGDGLVVILIFI